MKITDKMRLDWLQEQSDRLCFPGLSVGKIKNMLWGIYNANTVLTHSAATARKAIDAAIRASKPKKARGGIAK